VRAGVIFKERDILVAHPEPPAFEALYAGDDYCGALVGPVAVLIGRGLPGPLLAKHGGMWTKQLAARFPSGCGFMIVLRSEAPPPDEETRTRVSRFFEACSENATAGAIVIEGTGFVAATIRGFFGAYCLATSYRFRLRVHGTVEDAAPAIMARLDRKARDGAELVAGINALKAAYAAGTLRVAPDAPSNEGGSPRGRS
jgi:hypothetical protein